MATSGKSVGLLFANYYRFSKNRGLLRALEGAQYRHYTAEQRAKTKTGKKHSDSKVTGIEMLRDPKVNKVILMYT